MIKYTKAYTITPHDTNLIDPRPDAYYIGSGNFTDAYDEDDFYTPSVWFGGGRGMSGLFANALTAWTHGSGGTPVVGAISDVDRVVGTAQGTNTHGDGDGIAYIKNSNSGMTVDDDAAFNIGTGEFEIMTFVKIENKGDGVYQRIVSRDNTASNWSILRRATSVGGVLLFAIDGSDPVSSSVVPLDTWVILGVARDSGGDIQIYINGVADGAAVNNTVDLDADADADLILGSKWTGSAYTQSLQGYMAEFLLWETELSTAERASVVLKIQDRYLNTQRAKITTVVDPSDASTHSLFFPQVGTIIKDSPTIISNSASEAGDIVGLREIT